MFPIKYIENNLVFNHDGECFAYYELTPYHLIPAPFLKCSLKIE